jgi:WD40 repeat protein
MTGLDTNWIADAIPSPLVPNSEITIWTFEGDVVHSLSAHTSFVYTLSILPNGDVTSGGEDRSLRIWRGIFFRFQLCSVPTK